MNIGSLRNSVFVLCLMFTACVSTAQTQSAASASRRNDELKYVIYLSRHGVRSPTGKPEQYAKFSASPWPQWPVKPGYLTDHGYQLMKIFGAYDRAYLAEQGLLAASGCEDSSRVTIVADSDQRTRETGKAIAEGMLPGCNVTVHALPEGVPDPLFHPLSDHAGGEQNLVADAAIRGRAGGSIDALKDAYRPQLEMLDRILAGCGKTPASNAARMSIFNVPAKLAPGDSDHLVEMRGPLATASTLSENLLLEYTEGMNGNDLGWGCLTEANLREAIQLHTAEEDYADRTPYIARLYASNLLDKIVSSLEQSASDKPVAGALDKPGDRVLFLSGHDTNIAAVAGTLGLNWVIDGRRDDTPPGGALIFELWHLQDGRLLVRASYMAQTLDEMRTAQTLTPANPPAIAPVFVPGCTVDCSLQTFSAVVRSAIVK